MSFERRILLVDDEVNLRRVLAAILSRAEGEWGRSREYLDLLVDALAREGLDDPAMVRLRDLVDAHDELIAGIPACAFDP